MILNGPHSTEIRIEIRLKKNIKVLQNFDPLCAPLPPQCGVTFVFMFSSVDADSLNVGVVGPVVLL